MAIPDTYRADCREPSAMLSSTKSSPLGFLGTVFFAATPVPDTGCVAAGLLTESLAAAVFGVALPSVRSCKKAIHEPPSFPNV